MRIKVIASIPPELLEALDSVNLRYTNPVDLLSCLRIDAAGHFCGVFGDGDNGMYEWFIWRDNKLETSNCGYGMILIALREVLGEVSL